MRIAYLTTDEVNASLAGEFAALCGLDLCLVHPRTTAPIGGVRAVVYDADYLPAGHMASLAASLASGRSPAIAVHGYNLDEAQTRRLESGGVVVARTLTQALFAQLRDILGRPRRSAAVLAGEYPETASQAC